MGISDTGGAGVQEGGLDFYFSGIVLSISPKHPPPRRAKVRRGRGGCWVATMVGCDTLGRAVNHVVRVSIYIASQSRVNPSQTTAEI